MQLQHKSYNDNNNKAFSHSAFCSSRVFQTREALKRTFKDNHHDR